MNGKLNNNSIRLSPASETVIVIPLNVVLLLLRTCTSTTIHWECNLYILLFHLRRAHSSISLCIDHINYNIKILCHNHDL